MYDQHRELESSLREVSKCVGRTLKLLSKSGSPAAETYLAATRAFRALSETWSRHLEVERALFPRMLCCNLIPAESLERIAENNEAIKNHLAAILTATWPRSPQAGLHSIRTSVIKVLTSLLAQIETERTTILPVMPRMDRREPAAAHVEPEVQELVAT
jgi:hypothetical protein